MNLRIIKLNSKQDYLKSLEIRKKVFIEEQKVPSKLEIDSHEESSFHFMAYLQKKPIACGRFRVTSKGLKFERIATLKEHRQKGVGKSLLQFMLEYAQQNFPKATAYLHAQKESVPFYLKTGWTPVGEEFLEAEIPHLKMFFLYGD